MSDTNTPKGDAPAPQANEAKNKGEQQPAATFTREQVQAEIAAALKADRDAAAEKAAKEKEEAEAEAARKNGEFETLANTEKAKREKAEAELAALKLTNDVRDALAEHPDYATCAKYITPLLKPGADATAIKAAVTQYIADNPRQPKGSAGAPPAPKNRQVTSPKPNQERSVRRFSTLSYRG